MTPANCPYVAARHSLPNGEAGEGDHSWTQVDEAIWRDVCGADYDDQSVVSKWFAVGSREARRLMNKLSKVAPTGGGDTPTDPPVSNGAEGEVDGDEGADASESTITVASAPGELSAAREQLGLFGAA